MQPTGGAGRSEYGGVGVVQQVDIGFLIDRLDGLLQQSKRGFFGGRAQIDELELQQIINQMRDSFPNEVTQARRVLQERENILKSAQDEAEGIITLARNRAEAMLDDHGLLQEAKVRSEHLLMEANAQREAVIEDARRYALDAIESVDGALEALDMALASNKTRVRRVVETLRRQGPPPA